MVDSVHNLMMEYNWKEILEYVVDYINIKNKR